MPVLVLTAVAAVAAPAGYLTHTGLIRSGRSLAIARRNLTRGLFEPSHEIGTLESRGARGAALLRSITPDRSAARARRLVELAGRSGALTMREMLLAKLVLATCVVVVGFAVFVDSPGVTTVLVVALLAAGAYHLPDLVMWSRGEERQKAIAQELPDALDQMTVVVTAGLGFEAALARVAANGKGPLSEELSRTLQDISVGRPRREAYNALVQRTKVVELKRFVGAINQADAYGIAIADVLRVQADEMRIKRRQRAKEQGMKIPVKVTFPLMLCFLPALLLVVVGPAIMGLAGVLH